MPRNLQDSSHDVHSIHEICDNRDDQPCISKQPCTLRSEANFARRTKALRENLKRRRQQHLAAP